MHHFSLKLAHLLPWVQYLPCTNLKLFSSPDHDSRSVSIPVYPLDPHECLINISNSPGPPLFSPKTAPPSVFPFLSESTTTLIQAKNWKSSTTFFIFSVPEPINHKTQMILSPPWFSKLCTVCLLHYLYSFQVIISGLDYCTIIVGSSKQFC